MAWDLTVVCPLVDLYVHMAALDAGAVAELAASRKTAKYARCKVVTYFSHCNQWGLYGVRVRQRRDAALFPNYFGQTCYY